MAESSSAVPSSAAYDVFLNHRGPDVKKSFASHLYRRLLSYGLRVFLDQPELHRGDYFTPQIEDAIRSASVHVAIFSVGYVDSIWCLNELVQMLDSKAPIIPVFYHVKPTELRRTPGKKTRYAEALEKHERKTDEYNPQTPRYDSSTIEKWRNVLSKVADISGFELEACNGDEGELVDKVVERVLKKVKKPALTLDVAKYPTGLDGKVKDFENSVLLRQQQRGKPQIFGIVGLGGVGKTTFAKEFFNRKNSEYHRSCFLSDVKDNKDCLNLQKILLKRLTGSDNSVNSVDEGIEMLKKHLSSANALVIIDDVDHADQVYALWPHQTVNLHSDSLILITSRNKDVLISSGVEESSIYNLTGLTTPHSLELFCLHSFNRPHPPPEFESLVNKFLEACSRLPLSLKVLGALLNGKNTFYWEDQLNKLGRILPEEIKQVLKISYDSLDRDEKQIFLDIACFFIGEDRDMTVKIWDNGLCGFRNIQDRCLVEVNSEKEIKMHDHLRDLGREIADADASLPRRLWRPTEKIDDLLQQSSNEQVINEVRGIRMLDHTDSDSDDDSSAMPWLQRSSELFGNCVMNLCNMLGNMQYPIHGTGICMKKLQLLDTEDVLVDNILRKVQSPNLIWLRWKNCPYSSLPSSISMKNLRVLQVGGENLKTLWKTESQAPLLLRELRIDAPLSNIPKSIGQLRHLERIVITPFLGSSPRTTEIPQMKSLPECFGHLTNLQHIELSGCSALERLPNSFGQLMKLQYLDLKGCSALKSLPDSFGKLMKLQYLDLMDCINLIISSETLGNINTLEYINLSRCKKIEVLPPQVARQRSLEQLHFERTNLKELPPSLCDLKNLKELSIFHCYILKCLPASLGLLTQLTQLRIVNCPLIRELPLKVKTWSDLDSSILPRLQHLQLFQIGISEVSFAEGVCFNLRTLQVQFCYNLRKIDKIYSLAKLQQLDIVYCKELELQGIETLVSLTKLWIQGCVKLKSIRGLGQLTKLQQLWVIYCSELEEVEGIQDCMLLWNLDTTECPKLQWSAVILEQLRQRVWYLKI